MTDKKMSVAEALARFADCIEDIEQNLATIPQRTDREALATLTAATSGGVDDTLDAQRYRTMRDWFVREDRRYEIDPLGRIRKTTNEVVDAGVDALTAGQKDGGEM